MSLELEVREKLEISINRARRAYRTGGNRLTRILQNAEGDLTKRVIDLAYRPRAGGTMPFSMARAGVYREQIRIVLNSLTRDLRNMTNEQVLAASRKGITGTLTDLENLERVMTGVVTPIDFQRIERLVSNRIDASLLRKVDNSWNRYGAFMVRDFEDIMAQSAASGWNHYQTVRMMMRNAPARLAETLAAETPGWFPEPRGIRSRQYWAERIVRTETAYSHNTGRYETMFAQREQVPDMQKKILAVRDKRTALDSIAVDGQIKDLEQPFVDGAGRRYQYPPARPNDRETVVPWRKEFEDILGEIEAESLVA